MNIDSNVIENIWSKLRLVLQPVIDDVKSSNPDVLSSLQRSQNDSFPLRVAMTFLRQSDGDEIAYTIDLKFRNNQLNIESDISTDDGDILAKGPTKIVNDDLPFKAQQRLIEDWLKEYEFFVSQHLSLLERALTKI